MMRPSSLLTCWEAVLPRSSIPTSGGHVHLICGMNLPLVLEVVLAGPEPYDSEKIAQLVETARQAIAYVNDCETLGSDDE